MNIYTYTYIYIRKAPLWHQSQGGDFRLYRGGNNRQITAQSRRHLQQSIELRGGFLTLQTSDHRLRELGILGKLPLRFPLPVPLCDELID